MLRRMPTETKHKLISHDSAIIEHETTVNNRIYLHEHAKQWITHVYTLHMHAHTHSELFTKVHVLIVQYGKRCIA